MSTKSSSRKSNVKPQPSATKSSPKKVTPRASASHKAANKHTAKSAPPAVAKPSIVAPVGVSKQARLIALLRQTAGASIAQMMALTGWQSHTVRGTISGVLRKKLGLNVACMTSPDGGTHLYRIIGPAV